MFRPTLLVKTKKIIKKFFSVGSDSTTTGDVEESISKPKDRISLKISRCPKPSSSNTKAYGDNLSSDCVQSKLTGISNLCNESVSVVSEESNITKIDPAPVETCVTLVDELKPNIDVNAKNESIIVTKSVSEKIINSIEDVDNDSDIDVCGLSNKVDEACDLDSKLHVQCEDSDEEIDVCNTKSIEKKNIDNQEVVVVLEDVLDKLKYNSSYKKLKNLFFRKHKDKALKRKSISEVKNENDSFSQDLCNLSAEFVQKITSTVEEKTQIEEIGEVINGVEIVKKVSNKMALEDLSPTTSSEKDQEDCQKTKSIVPETECNAESEKLNDLTMTEDGMQTNENYIFLSKEKDDSFLKKIDRLFDEPSAKKNSLKKPFRETFMEVGPKEQFLYEEILKESLKKVTNYSQSGSASFAQKNSKSPKKLESFMNILKEDESSLIIIDEPKQSLDMFTPIKDKVQEKEKDSKSLKKSKSLVNVFEQNKSTAVIIDGPKRSLNISTPIKNTVEEREKISESPKIIKSCLNIFQENKSPSIIIDESNQESHISLNCSINDSKLLVKNSVCDSISPMKNTINNSNSSDSTVKRDEFISISPKTLNEIVKFPESSKICDTFTNEEENPFNFNLTYNCESDTKPLNGVPRKITQISESEIMENRESVKSLNTSEKDKKDSAIKADNSSSENNLNTFLTDELTILLSERKNSLASKKFKIYDLKSDNENLEDFINEKNFEVNKKAISLKIQTLNENEDKKSESSHIITQILVNESEVPKSTKISECLELTQNICKSKSKEFKNVNSESHNNSLNVESVNDFIVSSESHISPTAEKIFSISTRSLENQIDDNPLFYFQDITATEFTLQPAEVSSSNLKTGDELIMIDDDEESESLIDTTGNDSSVSILYQNTNKNKRGKSCVNRLSVEFVEQISKTSTAEILSKKLNGNSLEYRCKIPFKKLDHYSPQNMHENFPEESTAETPKEIIKTSPGKVVDKVDEKIQKKIMGKVIQTKIKKSPEKYSESVLEKRRENSPSSKIQKTLKIFDEEKCDLTLATKEREKEKSKTAMNLPIMTKIEVFKKKIFMKQLLKEKSSFLTKDISSKEIKAAEIDQLESPLKTVNKILVHDFIQLSTKATTSFFKELDENLKKVIKRKKSLPAFIMSSENEEDKFCNNIKSRYFKKSPISDYFNDENSAKRKRKKNLKVIESERYSVKKETGKIDNLKRNMNPNKNVLETDGLNLEVNLKKEKKTKIFIGRPEEEIETILSDEMSNKESKKKSKTINEKIFETEGSFEKKIRTISDEEIDKKVGAEEIFITEINCGEAINMNTSNLNIDVEEEKQEKEIIENREQTRKEERNYEKVKKKKRKLKIVKEVTQKKQPYIKIENSKKGNHELINVNCQKFKMKSQMDQEVTEKENVIFGKRNRKNFDWQVNTANNLIEESKNGRTTKYIFSELKKEKNKIRLFSEYDEWYVEESNLQVASKSNHKDIGSLGFQIEDIDKKKKLKKRKRKIDEQKLQFKNEVSEEEFKSEIKRLSPKKRKIDLSADFFQGRKRVHEHKMRVNLKKTKREHEQKEKINFPKERKKEFVKEMHKCEFEKEIQKDFEKDEQKFNNDKWEWDFNWNEIIEAQLNKKLKLKMKVFSQNENKKKTNEIYQLKEEISKRTGDVEHEIQVLSRDENEISSKCYIQDEIQERNKCKKRNKEDKEDERKKECISQRKQVFRKKIKKINDTMNKKGQSLQKMTESNLDLSQNNKKQEQEFSSKSLQKKLNQICCERPNMIFNPKRLK